MATTQAEYFQEHAASGDLTDAQMAELLSLPEGDTTTLMVESGKPDPAASIAGHAQNILNYFLIFKILIN